MQDKHKLSALYVVATPIGNLADISLRALDVLRAVDIVACEDTRTSATLLSHHLIRTPTLALHQHNEQAAAERVLDLLRQGKDVACICDAGTPAISDPGARLVRTIRDAGHPVIPIPGANAIAVALSASGLIEPCPFVFLGFLPTRSSARKEVLKRWQAAPASLVLYEAPHRVLECVQDLAAVLEPERELVIARELTKRFESIHLCVLSEAHAWLLANSDRQRGEFVLVLAAPPAKAADDLPAQALGWLAALLEEMPLKQAVALTARMTGASRNALYERALAMRSGNADDAPA